ncbi:transglutaminase domain-containing protein [Tenacibaculum ovolyticum]|uniref:transglutaminase domain-containing protein n=1 Tax=Tenacibaculum ovolyticum TaxID=104270 RepID=UPI00041683B0|nr:transglutaminase domain-containing protein [Tenacibaculum ovolyticum]
MKKILLTFFFLLITNYGFSQDNSIMKLVRETGEMKLDLKGLTEFAKNNLDNKENLAKFFFYWTSTNIEYNNKSLRERNDGIISSSELYNRQSKFEVYKNRKGICAGYSNIFKWFMDQMDIESVIISGHIRDSRNHYVELKKDDDFRHGWNAIKLNEKWIIVDTTWGTSNDISQSEYYFDIKPELAIITHYPENPEWQLLEKPLSLVEFNNSKFIEPFWFMNGFTDSPKLKADKEFYYLVFKTNKNKSWSIKLLFSKDNKNFNPIQNITTIEQGGFTYLKFNKPEVSQNGFYKINLLKNILTEYYNIINFKTI